MRVGVIGRTGMLLESARQILARGHEIAFVMTCRAEAYYEVCLLYTSPSPRDRG